MKIAILQDDFPPRHVGGAGTVAFHSAKELQRRGHEVLVITTERSSKFSGIKFFEGLRIFTISSDYDFRFQAYVSLWNPFVTRQVQKILTEFKPDVVHAHRVHGYLSYYSLVIAKRLGARVILSCHDVMPFNYNKLIETIDANNLSIPKHFNYKVSAWRQLRDSRLRYNPFRNIVIRYILRTYVDAVLAVSNALKEALEQNGIKNVHVVHNGINVQEKVNLLEVENFRKKYGVGHSSVFFTGKPIAIKGGLKLLDALYEIRAKVSHVQLLVVGREDDQTNRLIEHAKKLHMDDKVIVTGWLSGQELLAAYSVSSLVVVPSLCFDSFPTVNLEAMAAKKPVIATCFGGSSEVVEDGETGYIVNPYDERTLGNKIEELLSNKIKAEQFGSEGFARIANEFSIEKQTHEFEKYYRT
jgi:glycosyltransferase involved in cell wall biosynthesis